MLKRWRSKKHLRQVAELRCIICGDNGVAHHIIGVGNGIMGSKAADSLTFCLCQMQHEQLHADVKDWEKLHGSQYEHVAKTLARLKEEE